MDRWSAYGLSFGTMPSPETRKCARPADLMDDCDLLFSNNLLDNYPAEGTTHRVRDDVLVSCSRVALSLSFAST